MTDTKPKLTDAEIDALEGEALRATVAIHVLNKPRLDVVESWGINTDWYLEGHMLVVVKHDVPHYDLDANAVREVEEEIERRGLVEEYVEEIRAAHFLLWEIVTISPAQRCRAALKAVMR